MVKKGNYLVEDRPKRKKRKKDEKDSEGEKESPAKKEGPREKKNLVKTMGVNNNNKNSANIEVRLEVPDNTDDEDEVSNNASDRKRRRLVTCRGDNNDPNDVVTERQVTQTFMTKYFAITKIATDEGTGDQDAEDNPHEDVHAGDHAPDDQCQDLPECGDMTNEKGDASTATERSTLEHSITKVTNPAVEAAKVSKVPEQIVIELIEASFEEAKQRREEKVTAVVTRDDEEDARRDNLAKDGAPDDHGQGKVTKEVTRDADAEDRIHGRDRDKDGAPGDQSKEPPKLRDTKNGKGDASVVEERSTLEHSITKVTNPATEAEKVSTFSEEIIQGLIDASLREVTRRSEGEKVTRGVTMMERVEGAKDHQLIGANEARKHGGSNYHAMKKKELEEECKRRRLTYSNLNKPQLVSKLLAASRGQTTLGRPPSLPTMPRMRIQPPIRKTHEAVGNEPGRSHEVGGDGRAAPEAAEVGVYECESGNAMGMKMMMRTPARKRRRNGRGDVDNGEDAENDENENDDVKMLRSDVKKPRRLWRPGNTGEEGGSRARGTSGIAEEEESHSKRNDRADKGGSSKGQNRAKSEREQQGEMDEEG